MNQWFRGWRIIAPALVFTLLAVLAGRLFPACSGTLLFPGAMIVIFLLPIVGFDGSEHGLASFCLMIAFDTLIYSALFWLLLELVRLIRSRRESQGKI